MRGVGPLVDLAELGDRDVRIDLRGREAHVAQQGLDVPEPRAPFEHERGRRMP